MPSRTLAVIDRDHRADYGHALQSSCVVVSRMLIILSRKTYRLIGLAESPFLATLRRYSQAHPSPGLQGGSLFAEPVRYLQDSAAPQPLTIRSIRSVGSGVSACEGILSQQSLRRDSLKVAPSPHSGDSQPIRIRGHNSTPNWGGENLNLGPPLCESRGTLGLSPSEQSESICFLSPKLVLDGKTFGTVEYSLAKIEHSQLTATLSSCPFSLCMS